MNRYSIAPRGIKNSMGLTGETFRKMVFYLQGPCRVGAVVFVGTWIFPPSPQKGRWTAKQACEKPTTFEENFEVHSLGLA